MAETNQTPEGQEPGSEQPQEIAAQQSAQSTVLEDDIDFSGRLREVGRGDPRCKPIPTDELFNNGDKPTLDQLIQRLAELRAERRHSTRAVQTDD